MRSKSDLKPRKAALAFIFVDRACSTCWRSASSSRCCRSWSRAWSGGDTAARGRDLRRLRHGLGAHAVRLLAGPRRAVGPLRPPAGAAALHPRARPRLHPDGAGADLVWLFVGRVISGITAASFSTAYAYIADVTPAREARRRLRPHRRRLRRRLRAGAGARRRARRHRSAPAVLGRRGLQPRQCGLRLLRAAGVAAAGAAHGLQLGARQSAGLAAAAALQPRAARPRRRRLPLSIWRTWCCRPSPCSTPATATAGTAQTIGLTLAAVGVASGVVQGGLIKPIVGRFGERATLIAGLLFGTAGFAIYGLATTGLASGPASP